MGVSQTEKLVDLLTASTGSDTVMVRNNNDMVRNLILLPYLVNRHLRGVYPRSGIDLGMQAKHSRKEERPPVCENSSRRPKATKIPFICIPMSGLVVNLFSTVCRFPEVSRSRREVLALENPDCVTLIRPHPGVRGLIPAPGINERTPTAR